MGGMQTFLTTLSNPDKFTYIGGFSGSCGGRGGTFDPKTSCNGAFADPAAFNKKVKVLFLGIGSTEGPGTKNFSDLLTQAGIHNVYFESPGTAHEWLTWRRCLKDFAPRLFRNWLRRQTEEYDVLAVGVSVRRYNPFLAEVQLREVARADV